MADVSNSVGNGALLPTQPRNTDDPAEKTGSKPDVTSPTSFQNFEEFLNQTSISAVEKTIKSDVFDVVNDIKKKSGFVDPGENTPI